MQNYAFLSALEQSIVKINLLTLASLNGLVCWCDDMPAVRRGSNALESQIFFSKDWSCNALLRSVINLILSRDTCIALY